jgi:hypothetical protein
LKVTDGLKSTLSTLERVSAFQNANKLLFREASRHRWGAPAPLPKTCQNKIKRSPSSPRNLLCASWNESYTTYTQILTFQTRPNEHDVSRLPPELGKSLPGTATHYPKNSNTREDCPSHNLRAQWTIFCLQTHSDPPRSREAPRMSSVRWNESEQCSGKPPGTAGEARHRCPRPVKMK